MGLGDEIMALGRAEREYEQTGKPVSITCQFGITRFHNAWHGNPAWTHYSARKIKDGGGYRPYIKEFVNRRSIYDMDYRPRAGRVHLTPAERATCKIQGPFAVVAPIIKPKASPNKNWGQKRWEQVIAGFPIPVYQLCETARCKPIEGAIAYPTPTFRHALAVIERAAVVMCNEGGTHHMAASMGVPAVVVFGAFIPPQVTGYAYHYNLGVETPMGYCGRWFHCEHCKKAMRQITPEMVKEKAMLILESYNAD